MNKIAPRHDQGADDIDLYQCQQNGGDGRNDRSDVGDIIQCEGDQAP